LVLDLGLKVLIKDRDLCDESSLTYQRLGSSCRQYYLVLIKDRYLCGEPSFNLSILLIVASLLLIIIKEGPLYGESSFDLSIY